MPKTLELRPSIAGVEQAKQRANELFQKGPGGFQAPKAVVAGEMDESVRPGSPRWLPPGRQVVFEGPLALGEWQGGAVWLEGFGLEATSDLRSILYSNRVRC